MKIVSRLTALAALAATVAAIFAVTAAPAFASKLVFDDEFNTFDSSVWTKTDPWWQLHGHDDLEYFNPANTTVANGLLDLQATKQTANGYDYQSGIVSSLNHQQFLYGYFEMRAKLPAGPGIWPAFWLVGNQCEIDGLEVPGDVPGRLYMTYHEGDRQVYQGYKDSSAWTTGYHTYGIDWQPTYIKWYIDGQEVASYNHATPRDPQTICFNTIVGGIWSGPPTSATKFPNDFLVDYLRVYDTKPLPNSAPIATDDSFSTPSGVQLKVAAAAGVLANDTDANGDTLSASIASQPSHGTASLSADGSFTYTPAAGFWGVDSFTYQTSDGIDKSSPATVWVSVETPGVQAPVALPDTYTAPASQLLVIDGAGVLSNDSDPAARSMVALTLRKPSHGTLSLAADGSFIYVPTSGYAGTDSFTYVASNGGAVSQATAVSLSVTAPTRISTPTVKRSTRSNYRVSGSVSLGFSASGAGENSGSELVRVLVQRKVGGTWRNYRTAVVTNPGSRYSATVHLRHGYAYRVQTSVTGRGPAAKSAWSRSFWVR